MDIIITNFYLPKWVILSSWLQ